MTKSDEILILLNRALELLDIATQEMADPKHTLHLTRVENEVIKGRASVVKGAELLKLKLEGRRVND